MTVALLWTGGFCVLRTCDFLLESRPVPVTRPPSLRTKLLVRLRSWCRCALAQLALGLLSSVLRISRPALLRYFLLVLGCLFGMSWPIHALLLCKTICVDAGFLCLILLLTAQFSASTLHSIFSLNRLLAAVLIGSSLITITIYSPAAVVVVAVLPTWWVNFSTWKPSTSCITLGLLFLPSLVAEAGPITLWCCALVSLGLWVSEMRVHYVSQLVLARREWELHKQVTSARRPDLLPSSHSSSEGGSQPRQRTVRQFRRRRRPAQHHGQFLSVKRLLLNHRPPIVKLENLQYPGEIKLPPRPAIVMDWKTSLLLKYKYARQLAHVFAVARFDPTFGQPCQGPCSSRYALTDVDDSDSEHSTTAVDEDMPNAHSDRDGDVTGTILLFDVVHLSVLLDSDNPARAIEKVISRHKRHGRNGGGHVYLCRFAGQAKTGWVTWDQFTEETEEIVGQKWGQERVIEEEAWLAKHLAGARVGKAKPLRSKGVRNKSTKAGRRVRPLQTSESKRLDRAHLRIDSSSDSDDTDDVKEQTSKGSALAAALDRNFETAHPTNAGPHDCNLGALPEWDGVQRLVNDFRGRTSEPRVSRAVCAVCGEHAWAHDVSTFKCLSRNARPKAGETPLPSIVREGMRNHLKHRATPGRQKAVWAKTRGMQQLSECLLEPLGMDLHHSTLNMCTTCLTDLSNDTLPKLAIANGFFLDEIPGVLLDLTWAEKKVISLWRPSLHVLHLNGQDRVSKRSRSTVLKIRGHCISLPQKAASILSVLPPPASDLPEMIKAIFVSADGKLPDPILLKMLLGVRQQKIRDALEWLVVHHPDYRPAKSTISADNLATYTPPDTDDLIPPVFWASILASGDTAHASKDSASYCNADDPDHVDIEISDSDSDDDDGFVREEHLHMSGMVDVVRC